MRAQRAVFDQSGVLQQAEMPRYRGPADRERIGQLLDRAASIAEQLDDGASMRIAERVERIPQRASRGLVRDGNRNATVKCSSEEEESVKSFEASSTIAAPAEAVWSILTDGAGYPNWDSGIDRVEGKIAPGETIKLYVKVNPGRAFPVKVTEFKPGERMVFSGGMPLGLFKGVRTYTLTPDGNKTRFKMREEYTGPMLPMIWRSMPDLGPSFTQFANGLKQRAERTRP